MPREDVLEVEFVEKELIEVDIAEKELIDVTLSIIDVIGGRTTIASMTDTIVSNPLDDQALVFESGYWKNKSIVATVDPAKFVQGEIPTPSPPVSEGDKYTTVNNFQSGTLEIFLNGLKLLLSDITIYGNNQFSITIDTIASDVVTVNYIKP